MFTKAVMVAIEIYIKYNTWNWYKITPNDFFDTRVTTGTILIK